MASVNKAYLISLYVQGKSIPDVSREVCLSQSAVRHHLKAAGVLRSRAEGVRMSAWKISKSLKGKPNPMSAQTKKKLSIAAIKRGDKTAKGFRITSQGYAEYTRGVHKRRLIHRVIAEKMLGRKLCKKEVVHHVDGNRLNNSEDNLVVMNNVEHNKMHAANAYKERRRNQYGQFC